MMRDSEVVAAFLSDEHRALAARLDEVADELSQRPEPEDDEAAREEARSLVGELALQALYGPVAEGDLTAMCLVREALGWASPLADAVYALQALGSRPIELAGDDELRRDWLAPTLSGELIAGFAMTEPEAGSDVASLGTRAVRDGDQYVITGQKTFISNAGIADYYVVFASTDPQAGGRGVTAFLVPADSPGLEFAGPQVLSVPHPLGALSFNECRVPKSLRIGAEGSGFKLGLATLDMLRPTVGAAAAGMAARALDEALAHTTTRRQFGGTLAELQLVQAHLAAMAMELSAARLLVYRAAWLKDRGAERITLEAAMAKCYATEAAQRIIDRAVQVHGGRGVLADSVVDRLYRSVRALRIYEGATEVQHLVIAGQLVKRWRESHPVARDAE